MWIAFAVLCISVMGQENSTGYWVKKGAEFYNNGSYDLAEKCFNKSIELNSKSLESWIYKGDILGKLGKFNDALNASEKAIEIDPLNVSGWTIKGIVLAQQYKYNESMHAFDNAIKINPKNAKSWYIKGLALGLFLGRDNESLQASEKAIGIDPQNADAWLVKAADLSEMERYNESMTALDKATNLNPNLSLAWYAKGYIFNKQGKYDESIPAFNMAIKTYNSSAQVFVLPGLNYSWGPFYESSWSNKGHALLTLGRYNESIQALDRAIEIDPRDSGGWYDKGQALYKLGKYNESLRAYDRVVELYPSEVDAWVGKGQAFSALGRDADASEAFDKAANLIKENAGQGNTASVVPAQMNGKNTKSWVRTLSGLGNNTLASVQQTSNGGYIVAGEILDYNLIKFDSLGNQEWKRSFRNEQNISYSVQQTSDGGYIIAGSGYTNAGSGKDLIKTDYSGNEEWNKTLGGYVESVQQTNDGGYIIAGSKPKEFQCDGGSWCYNSTNAWLIKTDSKGNEIWNKTFGSRKLNHSADGYSVKQTTDGGYIISGITDGESWLIKTDSSGEMLWNKTFNGMIPEGASSVQQTGDGGYISISNSWQGGVWLIKTDTNGNELWNRTLDGSSNEAFSVQQTNDGGYIIAGQTNPVMMMSTGMIGKWRRSSDNSKAWLIKTDPTGNELWDKTFAGSGNSTMADSIQQTNDGGYIIVGETRSYWASDTDGWLIKTDANGN